MIRIILVDDHELMREGIKQFLLNVEDLQVISEASTGEKALDLIMRKRFDLMLLDLSLPGIHGLDLIEKIKRIQPNLPILILSMHDEMHVARKILRAGASGYITKDSSPLELIKAIRKVADGGKYISSDMTERIMFHDHKSKKSDVMLLSEQERKVLGLFAKGKKGTEISEELGISVKTVSAHKTNIKNKLGISNNVDLVIFAIENGC